jgi:hypothetical protein
MMESKVSHARAALADARHVRAKLEDELDLREWRLLWFLTLTLLRVVGHVLDKVDAKSSADVRAVVSRLYAEWKEAPAHVVFHAFIKAERDLILKEYRTSLVDGPVFIVPTDGDVAGLDQMFDLAAENLFRPLSDGPFAGEDGRDVLDQALEWWETQLDRIDMETS